MSIYATLEHFILDPDGNRVEVFVQGVPGHIEGDYDFLPGPYTGEDGELRGVFFVTAVTEKLIQRYINPLLMMSGPEYRRATFAEVMDALHEKIMESEVCPRCGRP